MNAGWVASAAVVGLAVVAIAAVARAGTASDLVLTYKGGRLAVRGRISASRANDVRAFFERELRPSGKVTVWVDGPKGRTPRIRVAGDLTKGEMQRIRNALTLILG